MARADGERRPRRGADPHGQPDRRHDRERGRPAGPPLPPGAGGRLQEGELQALRRQQLLPGDREVGPGLAPALARGTPGTAVGEFRVNTDQFSGNQYEPDITGLDNGGFVVTWFDTSGGSHDDGTGAGSGYDVWAHAYNADGTEITPEFRVNTNISGHQYNPSIATLSDGGFVATWHDSEIHGQRFDADGTTVGEPFQVNTWTSDSQYDSKVTGLDNGGFVVSWTSRYQDGSNTGIFSQRFDAAGTAISTVRLTGGADNDIVTFVDAQSEMMVDLGAGNDTLTLGDDTDSVRVEGIENVTLGGGDDVVRVEGAGATTIDGDAGDDDA